jgi:hypothetical protein
MDFSLQLLPEQPLVELIDVTCIADELGFRACYSGDETYHKDMWILFAAADTSPPLRPRCDARHPPDLASDLRIEKASSKATTG